MADKRPQLEKFITKKGVAVWPRLHEPDTKFKAEGEYSAKIRLSADDSQPLIDRIETLIAEAYEAEKERLLADPKTKAKAKSLKYADKPYKEATDSDGNETGEYEFNIKMKAQVTNKKTGKVTHLTPKLFDAKGKPLPESVQIWGGSTIKVAGRYNPFATAIGVGLSLRLEAVQVIELVTAGSGGNAGSYGFGEEDGYESNDEDTGGFDDETGGSDTSGDDSDF